MSIGACGDVNKVPDAGVIDAYVPDTAVPLTCGSGETACNGTCANLQTNELYCGNCTTQCSPTQGCLNGSCVPANTNCQRVKDLDPNATDGAYRNLNNGGVFYCDFTARKSYEFGLGLWNAGYGGYSIMTLASFDDATKKAFIGYYNLVGGIPTIATFTSNVCCITQPNGNELAFGAPPNFTTLAQNGSWACNISYNDVYQLMKGQPGQGGVIVAPPVGDDFFTTSPVGEYAQCGDMNNIGLFLKLGSF